MKASEVLSTLQITRPTLSKYVKEKRIRVNIQQNGRYQYNKEDVYKIINKGLKRKTCIYTREFSGYPREDQLRDSRQYCLCSGIAINGFYIEKDDTKKMIGLLEEVMKDSIENIVIADKNILNHLEVQYIDLICKKHNCRVTFLVEY